MEGTAAPPIACLRLLWFVPVGGELRAAVAGGGLSPHRCLSRGVVMKSVLLDAAGRRRSPATLPGFHSRRLPRRTRGCAIRSHLADRRLQRRVTARVHRSSKPSQARDCTREHSHLRSSEKHKPHSFPLPTGGLENGRVVSRRTWRLRSCRATGQSTRRCADAPPSLIQQRRGHDPRRHRELRANHEPPGCKRLESESESPAVGAD